MLELKKCTDKKLFTQYCKKCGKIPDESFFMYIASDRDKLLAAALFEVECESVSVLMYECADSSAGETDYWLFDGIMRAGFNYASEQGIETGCISESFRLEWHKLFEKLNYPAAAEFNITNFFKKYKNCNK